MPPRDFLSHLRGGLDKRRTAEADIWTSYQVVRPLDPRGLTVIRSQCNAQEIVASNVTGLTFAPGAGVTVGTHTNRPGKVIIAGPPPGRMGASLVPQDYAVRTYGTAPAPACPQPLTGRSYLGIVDQDKIDSTETLWAYRYTDGGYVETLASYDYSGDGINVPSIPGFQRVHGMGDVVIFTASGLGADLLVCTWDIDANTLAIAECTHPAFVDVQSQAVWNGASDAYFFLEYGASDPRDLQLYKVAVGASGAWDEPAARVGSVLAATGPAGISPGPQLLHSGGAVFQVPSIYYGNEPINGEEAIPSFSGGSWDNGLGRNSYANDLSMGSGHDGYEITGSRSIRATFGPSNDPPAVLGVLASSGSETSLLGADWSAAVEQFYSLAVSPSKAEVAILVDPVDGGTEVNKLLRLNVSTVPDLGACALPLITIEPSPETYVPQFMLCRDN